LSSRGARGRIVGYDGIVGRVIRQAENKPAQSAAVDQGFPGGVARICIEYKSVIGVIHLVGGAVATVALSERRCQDWVDGLLAARILAAGNDRSIDIGFHVCIDIGPGAGQTGPSVLIRGRLNIDGVVIVGGRRHSHVSLLGRDRGALGDGGKRGRAQVVVGTRELNIVSIGRGGPRVLRDQGGPRRGRGGTR